VPAEAQHGRAHLWLLLPAAALGALWLAWRSLAMVDFLYPAFYDAMDIDGHIQHFAPQNLYKSGFEDTTREERIRLFSEIVTAIHASGEGLAQLEYRGPDGGVIDRLLREPEVGHLQDVARLVDRLSLVGWLAVGWLAAHLLLIRLRGWSMPTLAWLLGASALATAGGVAIVLVVGPRRVFYWLHEVVFPPEHPWFFYYQESLMATMMKAPYLFGGIAAVLLALALALYSAILVFARRLG
jgi:hypothetical protein